MGRKYAPVTANLYLKKFDKAAMEGFRIHPVRYSRFLDDISGVWPGTQHARNSLNIKHSLTPLSRAIK